MTLLVRCGGCARDGCVAPTSRPDQPAAAHLPSYICVWVQVSPCVIGWLAQGGKKGSADQLTTLALAPDRRTALMLWFFQSMQLGLGARGGRLLPACYTAC